MGRDQGIRLERNERRTIEEKKDYKREKIKMYLNGEKVGMGEKRVRILKSTLGVKVTANWRLPSFITGQRSRFFLLCLFYFPRF